MSTSKFKSLFQFVLYACVLSFVCGCNKSVVEETSTVQEARPAKLATVTKAGGESVRTFPATVEPSIYAHLAFRVNGELLTVDVVAGQQVEKGDTLATLDKSDFIIEQKQAEARFKLSQSQFDRAKKLLDEKLISSAEFDQIQAELEIASAQLDAANNNLKYSVIKAPFAGVIARINVEQFEFIQAKQPIMEIQGRETIDVAIEVPEQLMIRLPKKSAAQAYQPSLVFETNPDKKYKVTLKEHDIAPNPATRSYHVVFSLPTPEEINVLPGMTATLEVELDKLLANDENALIVPVSAVFVPNSKVKKDVKNQTQFVMKVDGNMTTQLVPVVVKGTRQDGMIVKSKVANGLQSGDKVVSAGPHLVKEGTKVSEWKQERGL